MPNTVIQWNIQSWRSNFCELKKLIQDFNPICLCLQETLMTDRSIFGPSRYNVYHSSRARADGHERGTALLIRADTQSQNIDLNSSLQVVARRVWIGRWYSICSLYLPHSPVSENEILTLISQLPTPYIILGDMNARNELWGDTVTNQRGTMFENILLSNDISILNSQYPTHYHVQTGTSSIIDLALCSSDCLLDFNHRVTDDLRGSDHFPILIEFTAAEFIPLYPARFKTERADWEEFYLQTSIGDTPETLTVDERSYKLENALINAAERSIPRSTGRPGKIPVPWWNSECQLAYNDRKRAQRALHRSRSLVNLIAYKRAKARCRYIFKKSRKQTWEEYVSEINSRTPASLVWKRIKKIEKKYCTPTLPLLKQADGSLTNDPNITSNLFAEAYTNVSNPVNYSPEFLSYRQTEERKTIDFSTNVDFSYNEEFSMKEFQHALSNSSDSSPGLDQITYKMILKSHYTCQRYILNLFNQIFFNHSFPESWKLSVIIPIAKQGKDLSDPLNYRPISLTSCLCKLFEKMVNLRLKYFLEINNIIHPQQTGFREGFSTSDSLVQFSNHVHEAVNRQEHTDVVCFDLMKAYDTTWKYGVIKKLYSCGLRGNLPRTVRDFLNNRRVCVRIGTVTSQVYLVFEGLPQGSVLSCTLFTLSVNDLPQIIPHGVKSALYVDDFTIWSSSRLSTTTKRRLQLTLNKLKQWSGETGFKFSPTKTVALHICRKKNCPKTIELQLDNVPITQKETHKLLGLTIDSSLTWKAHIKELRNFCFKRVDLLKFLSHRSWGSDTALLLRLYKSLIRSKMEYGYEAYGSACKSLLRSVEPIQNLAIRIATGALRSSPIDSLTCISGVMPFRLYGEVKTVNFILRAATHPSNPLCDSISTLDIASDTDESSSDFSRRSFMSRCRRLLIDYEINFDCLLTERPENVPPWKNIDINVCDEIKIKKSEISTFEMRSRYYDHLQKHTDSLIVYTDGSKTESGVGYGVSSQGFETSRRVNDLSSIYSAELLGILHAVEYANTTNAEVVTIVTDSQSAITALKSLYPQNAILRKILYNMSLMAKSFQLCWVPGHIGVSGNERADTLANQARSRNNIYFNSITRNDLKCCIRQKAWKKWREYWMNLQPSGNKLRNLGVPSNISSQSSCLPRMWERALVRLRIGHCRFSHQHLMEGRPPPECELCGDRISVEHVLLECVAFSQQRAACFPVASQRTLRFMLIECDTSIGGKLFNYLNEIGILYRI